jgi:hypothetical protein
MGGIMATRLASRILWLIAAFTLFSFTATPAQNVLPRVTAYRLDVTFFPVESRMEGIAHLTFEPVPPGTDSLIFYLHGELRVDSVLVSGQKAEKRQAGQLYYYDYSLLARRVAVDISQIEPPDSMTVYYGGYFHVSRARAPSDYMRIDTGGVFLRSYGYSLWFPIALESQSDDYVVRLDDVTLRTPLLYKSVLIGDCLSVDTVDNWYVSRWSADAVQIRDIGCVARPFVIEKQPDVILYYLDDSLSIRSADYLSGLVGKFRSFYRGNFGEILAGPIHLIEMPKFGDISDHNIVGLDENDWRTVEQNDWAASTLAHELVHPYVQAYTTRDDSLYSMVIEGFSRFYFLPALAEVWGEDRLIEKMARIEESYLKAKATGLNRRGHPLPIEIPLLEIAPDQIGTYKDGYILSDRATLFLYWLYREMGTEDFYVFSREAFDSEKLTLALYLELSEKYMPGSGDDIRTWLSSNDYPERFHLSAH